MGKKTVAELLVETLVSREVSRIYGVAGDSLNGITDFATDLDNPDFAKMAEAAGLRGLTAERPEQVRPMIAQAFAHDGPALVEVPVHRRELAMPPTIKTNLWR
jgi:thiamine pyrophosphate-dependent acetolactate synthase large subunit-like protein